MALVSPVNKIIGSRFGVVSLGGIFIAEREIARRLRGEILPATDLSYEEALLLLEVYGASALQWDHLSPAGGAVSQAALQRELNCSQAHVSRKLERFRQKRWVETVTAKGERACGFRTTGPGKQLARRVWDDCLVLAQRVTAGAKPPDLRTHLRVNQLIREKLRLHALDRLAPIAWEGPIDNLLSILDVRRDLVGQIHLSILSGSGLTIETADVLVDLYCAKNGGQDPSADENGFVSYQELKTGLVHWQTVTATLLSQRLAVLSGQGLVERKGGRGKNFVKITDPGVARIKGVFERYDNLGKHLLDGVSPADRDTHFSINNLIRSNLDPAWACTQAARGMPGA